MSQMLHFDRLRSILVAAVTQLPDLRRRPHPKYTMTDAALGVFVNRKRAHLIIENGPTWGMKGSAVIIENEPI